MLYCMLKEASVAPRSKNLIKQVIVSFKAALLGMKVRASSVVAEDGSSLLTGLGRVSMNIRKFQAEFSELSLTRVWEPVSSDLVWTVVLRVLRPGGHPHVWHPAGWCG